MPVEWLISPDTNPPAYASAVPRSACPTAFSARPVRGSWAYGSGDLRLRRRLVVGHPTCADSNSTTSLVHVWSAQTGRLRPEAARRRLGAPTFRFCFAGPGKSITGHLTGKDVAMVCLPSSIMAGFPWPSLAER